MSEKISRPMEVWEGTTAQLNEDGLWQNIGNPTPIDPDGFHPNQYFENGSWKCEYGACGGNQCNEKSRCGYWYSADSYELIDKRGVSFEEAIQNNDFAMAIVKNMMNDFNSR